MHASSFACLSGSRPGSDRCAYSTRGSVGRALMRFASLSEVPAGPSAMLGFPDVSPSNGPDDFHDGREAAHAQPISVAKLAPAGAADGLVVHERPIGRAGIFDHDRP